jgi:hypothetical protein
MSECGTCGGIGFRCAWGGKWGHDAEDVVPHGDECIKIPCPNCRRVVSVEDAEVAAAVREIEAEGLSCWRDGAGIWHVAEEEDEPKRHGTGKTLPAALAAYKAA